MPTYPTEWAYGKPVGSIREEDKRLLLRHPIKKGSGKQKSMTFTFSKYKNRDECWAAAEKERIKISHDLGLTINEIRYTDEDTIEVKLTRGKTFITDAKYIEFVNKYKLFTLVKREKNRTRYYVIAQKKKKKKPFRDFIIKCDKVDYLNGKTLDLRECNLKESGFEYKIEGIDNTDHTNDADIIENMSKYYFMEMLDLPKNKWILGNIPGTTFPRKSNNNKIITMVIIDLNRKKRTKTFKVKDHGTIEKTKDVAQIYNINYAHAINVVTNKIRILDDVLEVMIDDDVIMKTDLIFLPLFIPSLDTFNNCITVNKTFNNIEKIYAGLYIRNTLKSSSFHKFIMGGEMIDHINRDPLDNRLINLRFTTASHNNTNRTANNITNITGVTYGTDTAGEYYRARIKENGIEYGKFFYTHKHGENSRKLAIKLRVNILELNDIKDDLSDLSLDESNIPLLNNAINRTKDYLELMDKNIVYNYDKYLPGLTDKEIDPKIKKLIFNKYLTIQSLRMMQLTSRISTLEELIGKIKRQRNRLNSRKVFEI